MTINIPAQRRLNSAAILVTLLSHTLDPATPAADWRIDSETIEGTIDVGRNERLAERAVDTYRALFDTIGTSVAYVRHRDGKPCHVLGMVGNTLVRLVITREAAA